MLLVGSSRQWWGQNGYTYPQQTHKPPFYIIQKHITQSTHQYKWEVYNISGIEALLLLLFTTAPSPLSKNLEILSNYIQASTYVAIDTLYVTNMVEHLFHQSEMYMFYNNWLFSHV